MWPIDVEGAFCKDPEVKKPPNFSLFVGGLLLQSLK